MTNRPLLCWFFACFLFPTAVYGHAEEPASRDVYVTSDADWVVRANFGIVTSEAPDRFVCEEAFLGGDGWLLGVLGPLEWITFGESEVRRTTDGCTFDLVARVDARPSDATVHPDSGTAAYIVNSPEGSRLFVSTNRGASFDEVQTFRPANTHLTGVRFLDSTTALVSAYEKDTERTAHLYRVHVTNGEVADISLPAGLTFPYVLDARAGQVALLARRDAQVVFWGAAQDLTSAAEYEAASWPTGALLSSDGTRLWIAGVQDGGGLTVGTRAADGVTWEDLLPQQAASCLGGSEEALYLCGLARLDGADVFRAEGETVRGMLNFDELRGPRRCPATSDVGEICPLVWNEIASYFGADPDADLGGFPESDTGSGAGSTDAGHKDAAGAGDAAGGGCCATTDSRSRSDALWVVLGLLMGSLRRRYRDGRSD